MKIGVVSLGCSKNLVDSERIMSMLKKGGHVLVNDPSQAEAIIINTCGFIQPAKEEAIDTIFEMAEYKNYNCRKLIVCGCLAQRYKEDLIEEMPEVDRFVAISEYPHLHEILEEELGQPLNVYGKDERMISTKPWTAYLKIAEGCSNRCTYCAIPLIRGDNVTFPIEDLVKEATELADRGVKELVLIAQDTTKYGLDLYGELKLPALLIELQKIEKLHWIRILYMYPDEITEELIDTMASLDKVLPYFDIPMQHASNKMLKLMNRRGTNESVVALVDKIKNTFKDPTLRTTFIVGFPYEEEQDFDELLEFIKVIKWDRMGSFTYSVEEDTPAYDYEQTVSEEVKQQRLDRLMKLQSEISYENSLKRIGDIIEVLVERKDGLANRYVGRHKGNAPDDVDGVVYFTSTVGCELGSFVQVKVERGDNYDLYGIHVQ